MLLHDIVFMALHIVYRPLFLLQIVTPDTVLSAINAVRCGEKMSLNLLLPVECQSFCPNLVTVFMSAFKSTEQVLEGESDHGNPDQSSRIL